MPIQPYNFNADLNWWDVSFKCIEMSSSASFLAQTLGWMRVCSPLVGNILAGAREGEQTAQLSTLMKTGRLNTNTQGKPFLLLSLSYTTPAVTKDRPTAHVLPDRLTAHVNRESACRKWASRSVDSTCRSRTDTQHMIFRSVKAHVLPESSYSICASKVGLQHMWFMSRLLHQKQVHSTHASRVRLQHIQYVTRVSSISSAQLINESA
jgi:hypothetical protein